MSGTVCQCLVQLKVQKPTVRQPGQRIVEGLVLHLRLGCLARTDIGDKCREMLNATDLQRDDRHLHRKRLAVVPHSL